MVRPSSSKKANVENPEAIQRTKLKQLALKNNILSETPAKCSTPLTPSKLVQKHHGKDIIRKSQRKNRFLFSFPGLLAPISGGKIGELKDLGTKNPLLYLDFPQGQMKLFGTIVYPKNRYLSLQFSRGGKNVVCEDYFDNMIVFSDVWWIGRKEDNPEEARLDFPKELCEGQSMEFDFKGGAGEASVNKKNTSRTETKDVDVESSEDGSGDDLLDDDKILKSKIEVTPTRHSERNAGKKFKYAETSSEDDADMSDGEEKKNDMKLGLTGNDTVGKTNSSHPLVVDIESEDDTENHKLSPQIQASVTAATKSRKASQSAVAVTKSKENSHSSHGPLVQATISSLFKKVGGKTAPRDAEKTSSSKVSDQKLKRKTNQAQGSRKKRKLVDEQNTGGGITGKRKQNEVDDKDIEEPSSKSQDYDSDDGDWVA